MLYKHCPHTDIVNFFTAIGPAMAVGSILQVTPSQFVWRSYLTHESGSTRLRAVAESRLNRALGRTVRAVSGLQGVTGVD
jgi:hypothetical protein